MGASLVVQSVKNLPANAGDTSSIQGSGRSPGEGNGTPLQYSCLENPMDRGAWRATVHGVARVKHDLVTKPPHTYKARTANEIWIRQCFGESKLQPSHDHWIFEWTWFTVDDLCEVMQWQFWPWNGDFSGLKVWNLRYNIDQIQGWGWLRWETLMDYFSVQMTIPENV